MNQCGLSFRIVESLIPQLKYSPSLVAVHLSNNPGVVGQIKNLSLMLGIEIEKHQVKPNLQFQTAEDSKKKQNSTKTKSPSSKEGEMLSLVNLEQIQTRKLLKEKEVLCSYLCTQDPYAGSIFLLQRTLGFDE